MNRIRVILGRVPKGPTGVPKGPIGVPLGSHSGPMFSVIFNTALLSVVIPCHRMSLYVITCHRMSPLCHPFDVSVVLKAVLKYALSC